MTDPLEEAKVYYESGGDDETVAKAMMWAWFDSSTTVNFGWCLEYAAIATEEEKDALIVAHRLRDKGAAVTISDQILERYDES